MLDPWWLVAIPLAAFFVWRIVTSLRRRDVEGAYWIGAAAAFGAAPGGRVLFTQPLGHLFVSTFV